MPLEEGISYSNTAGSKSLQQHSGILFLFELPRRPFVRKLRQKKSSIPIWIKTSCPICRIARLVKPRCLWYARALYETGILYRMFFRICP